MKKIIIISFVAAVAANSFGQDFSASLTKSWEGQLGVKATTGLGLQENASYSNVTTFTGFGYINGGATSTITNLVADDLLTLSPSTAIESFSFTVANFDPTAFTARPRIRFYDDNAGTPGNALVGYSFAPISFGSGSVTIFTASITPGQLVIPASGKLWAGITFDNASGSTATTANLNNLGQGLFNPPTQGSSTDLDFVTSSPGSWLSNNPTGSTRTSPFNNSPAANYGWAFTAVPESASFAVIGLGLLGLVTRRRKSSK